MCRSHSTKLIGIRLAALLALLATSTVAARAEDVPPLHARIDAAIETGLIGTPAAEADDAAMCRHAGIRPAFFGLARRDADGAPR